MPAASIETVIGAADGFALAASVRRSPPDVNADVVVIAGATGVKRQFYAAFADFLAARGFSVVTFDYRGVGGSRPEKLKGFHATMAQWGTLDLDAVLRWTKAELAPRRLLVVGHSVGGQLLGLAPAAEHVDAAIFIGSQSGYVGHWPFLQRFAIGALWYVFIPTLSPIFGKFPSRAFKLGEDLPSGVAREWARWGRHRDYILRDGDDVRARYARLQFPIRAHAIRGDFYAPEKAVRALVSFYGGKLNEVVLLDGPGHFTYFRPKWEPLWSAAADWFHSSAPKA